jgi:putative membrane protein
LTASHRRFALSLVLVFLAVAVALAVAPYDRHDWLLENVLSVIFAVVLVASYRRLPLSRVSYGLIFLVLCLHQVGAHDTYAKVPYDDWAIALTGGSLNGLLLTYPIREVFLRVAEVHSFWGYFLPLDFTMSTSMLYELIEWGAAELFGGKLGMAYLGTQGDLWDAHKDMALASLGAVIAMTVTAAVNARLRRDFARERAESLRVKHPWPLGEVKIAWLRHPRNKG